MTSERHFYVGRISTKGQQTASWIHRHFQRFSILSPLQYAQVFLWKKFKRINAKDRKEWSHRSPCLITLHRAVYQTCVFLKICKMEKKKEKGEGGKYLFVLISLRHISCPRNNFPHHSLYMQLPFYFIFTKRQGQMDTLTLWKRSKCWKFRNTLQYTLFLKIFASLNCGVFFSLSTLPWSLNMKVHDIHNR